jgi:hypothetical protein
MRVGTVGCGSIWDREPTDSGAAQGKSVLQSFLVPGFQVEVSTDGWADLACSSAGVQVWVNAN